MDRNEIITVVALLVFALLLLSVWRVDRHRRRVGDRHSPVSGVLGIFDEAFRPEAARAVENREVQRELPAEVASSGDKLGDSRHDSQVDLL